MTEINLCNEVLENAIGVHRSLEKIEPLKIMDAVAVQAMEELLKYRAIGTIEEFKDLKEDKNFLEFLYNHIPPNEMEQYLSMYHIKEKIAVNGYADQSGLMSST